MKNVNPWKGFSQWRSISTFVANARKGDHDDWLYGLNLVHLEKLWRSTTPGPWRALLESQGGIGGSSFIQTAGADLELIGGTDADLEFIAAVHAALPAMLAQLRRAAAP